MKSNASDIDTAEKNTEVFLSPHYICKKEAVEKRKK